MDVEKIMTTEWAVELIKCNRHKICGCKSTNYRVEIVQGDMQYSCLNCQGTEGVVAVYNKYRRINEGK